MHLRRTSRGRVRRSRGPRWSLELSWAALPASGLGRGADTRRMPIPVPGPRRVKHMVHGPPCQSAPTPHRVPRGEVAVTFARSKRLLCDRSWCVCLSSC